MITKELTTKYDLKQAEAARLLGVTQPAISLYYRKIRGKAIDLEKDPAIMKLIEDLAASMAKGTLARKDFISMFCGICRAIRAKGLLCKMHKTFDQSGDIEKCELCMIINSARCA